MSNVLKFPGKDRNYADVVVSKSDKHDPERIERIKASLEEINKIMNNMRNRDEVTKKP